MIPTPLDRAVRRPILAIGLAFAATISLPVAGDDKPKPNPAEGTPLDETYGLFGSFGGKIFRDRARGRLVSIKVRVGTCVNSIQCIWSEAGKSLAGEVHGFEGDLEAIVELDPGEFLNKVSGYVLPVDGGITFISGLTLTTNKRKIGPYGQFADRKNFELEAPKGTEICGFHGYSSKGEGLHALGIAVRPIDPGDGKPKPAEPNREGLPSGKIYGAARVATFRDRAVGRLASIKVRAGLHLVSLRCTWTGADKPVEGVPHGGCGGTLGMQGPETAITFEEGEFLIKLWGIAGQTQDNVPIITSITLKTNKRSFGPFGDRGEGAKFLFEAPEGEEICGFRGRSGWYIDAIGILVRPISGP